MNSKSLLFFVAAATVSASAFAQQDTTFVRMDFNANVWNYPTASIIKGWSTVDWDNAPAGAIFSKTTQFSVPVGESAVKLTLTPSDLDETEYENAYVNGPNYDQKMDGSVVENYLFTFVGSTMTLTAPEGYYMTRVSFNTYRTWSSGSLSTNPVTSEKTWGPDSLKTVLYVTGQTSTPYPCWEGDSLEWSLPACTGSTRLRHINFWLLPTATSGISAVADDRSASTRTLYNLQGVALEGTPAKGFYIDGNKKKIVK